MDNQIVSFIANNQTAISAWVDPTSPRSRRIGLFAELSASDSVELMSFDVWQLAVGESATDVSSGTQD